MNTSGKTGGGCQYCPHPAHPGAKCTQCKCKGKAKWWNRVLDGIGNAIGEAKFGGE
jgi:hypothetical protein